MSGFDFDRHVTHMIRFFWVWFALVAVGAITMMAGSAYVVFLLLQHFGVV